MLSSEILYFLLPRAMFYYCEILIVHLFDDSDSNKRADNWYQISAIRLSVRRTNVD